MGDKTNSITQGFLCPRGYRDIERVYSEERVLYPYYRAGDQFERMQWDDALSLLTEKLHSVLEEYGPESCIVVDSIGNMGLLSAYLPQRLFYALKFTRTDGSICSKSGHTALSLHYGSSYGAGCDELLDTELTVYWGFNAAVSAPHLYALSSKTRKKGGFIVVIDPRKSETAQSADLWIQVKPGGDVVLAYGVIKYLIENDKVDSDFITKYTQGFDALKKEVSTWDINSIEAYTGIPWNTITKLAELYSTYKKNMTMIGIGMQKSVCGAESVRAISFIPAVLGIHRGFYYSNYQAFYVDLPYITGETISGAARTVSQVALGNFLKRGEFKFVYIYNTNPAVTLPNQKAVSKGLNRTDVFVTVHDTHWTDTARSADLVLPAATFFEKEDVVIPYSHKYVRKLNRVINPLGESKSELWISAKIAERLHLKEEWLHEDEWDVLSTAFEDALEEGDINDLKKGNTVTLKMKPRNEYQTPSGRIELCPDISEVMHLSSQPGSLPSPLPLPMLYSPPEDTFIFLNSAVKKYTHTQFQDIHGLIPSLVFINLKDALHHNIRDTDIVEVYNELGSIKLKAVTSVSVPQGVLWAPREGKDIEGTPQNSIIPDMTQKIGGGPVVNSTLVKIKKHRS